MRIISTMLGGAVLAACLSTPAAAGIHISIPIEIIATDTPVYYQGRAAYWYEDRWYYRSGREWRTYSVEPVYLRDYRVRHAHERRFYGRGHDRWRREERWEERRREERREERRERERDRRHDRYDHH